jgi:hypothetical protein
LDAYYFKIGAFPANLLLRATESGWIVTGVTDKYLPIFIINVLSGDHKTKTGDH